MGANNYYINSRHHNTTNINISKVSRLDPIKSKYNVAPTDYNPVDELNGRGKYQMARHQSVSSTVFSKADRKGIVERSVLANPGPGQ